MPGSKPIGSFAMSRLSVPPYFGAAPAAGLGEAALAGAVGLLATVPDVAVAAPPAEVPPAGVPGDVVEGAVELHEIIKTDSMIKQLRIAQVILPLIFRFSLNQSSRSLE